jgi:hypothetical protein
MLRLRSEFVNFLARRSINKLPKMIVILSEASLRAESKDLARHPFAACLRDVVEKPITAAKAAAARSFAPQTALRMTK